MGVLEHDETPVGALLLTVLMSIVEVFLICAAGYILAWRGILDKPTQKKINHINVSLFTPALLFSKVAFFLTPAKMMELWVIPVCFVVVTATSMMIAYSLSTIFRLKRSERSFAMAAAMFMNSNSLPIALMQSLVVTVPVGLEWGQDDSSNAMVGRALTYLVIHSTLGMVLRWSYGVRLLSQADEAAKIPRSNASSCTSTPRSFNERTPLLAAPHKFGDAKSASLPNITRDVEEGFLHPYGATHRQRTCSESSSTTQDSRFSSTVIGESRIPAFNKGDGNPYDSNKLHYSSSPTVYSVDTQDEDEDEDEDEDDSRGGNWFGRMCANINGFMTAPLWASLAALIVAGIPSLQYFLEHHATPVKGAMNAAGNCSIPLTLVVLGAYFYKEMEPSEIEELVVSTASSEVGSPRVAGAGAGAERTDDHDNGSLSCGVAKRCSMTGETKTVIVSVLSRMILTPMALIPLLVLSSQLGWDELFQDPIFIISNVLLIASPPALTLAQLTQQAASGEAFERMLSRTVFWSYCVVTPPSTILFVFVGMLISKA